MTKNQNNKSVSDRPQHALKANSQRRRQGRAVLATASPELRLMRNDLVPKLALIACAPADLVIPARTIRKIKAAHLGEVATAISRLGFCDPVLIDERNTVLDGVKRPSFSASPTYPVFALII